MSDFSSTEKINASWKHLFGLLGTNPTKAWYEELIAASHIVTPNDIWSSNVPAAATKTEAIANVGAVVENRADGQSITLATNGSNWNITCSFLPRVGYQVTNVHPNPSYIRSITAVIDNGGGSYTITLSSNSGVSAGAAVIHRRIYLTVDPTANNLVYFAKSVYANTFSSTMENFIHPQKFGKGYTVRLFQANGTEVLTTEGAWIFNWQKGLLLFATGFSPVNLSYAQPLYIEAFRYTGSFGGSGSSLTPGNLNDTLRFDGLDYVPTSALQSDGTNVNVLNRLTVSGSTVLPSGIQPTSSGTSGLAGEFRWDNNYLYIKTALGWARTDIRYF